MVVHMQEGDLPHVALQHHDELQTDGPVWHLVDVWCA